MVAHHLEPNRNRYEHVVGLANRLLSSGEASVMCVGLPQGDIGLNALVTAVLNECDIIGIGQRGSGRLAMSGIQRASNLPGAGLMGRAFGKILSLHDFVAERRMFTADIKGDSLKGVTSARVLAVDYHAHGYVASTHVKSFVATLVRVEGYVDSATADPVSVVTVIPRNQSVLTHGTHTPDNPLEHAIHMLEIVSERPGV